MKALTHVKNITAEQIDEQHEELFGVLNELLSEQRNAEVVELFGQMVGQVKRLKLYLTELLHRRRKGEGVSSA